LPYHRTNEERAVTRSSHVPAAERKGPCRAAPTDRLCGRLQLRRRFKSGRLGRGSRVTHPNPNSNVSQHLATTR